MSVESGEMANAWLLKCLLFALLLQDCTAQPQRCLVRYEFRDANLINGDRCRAEACQKDIMISYVDYAPYIYRTRNGSQPEGLLVDIIIKGLQACCPDCYNITKWTRLESYGQISQTYNQSTVFLPVAMPEDPFPRPDEIAFPFVSLVKRPKIVFAEIYKKETTSHQMKSVVDEVRKLWPLLAISVLSTLVAGASIWLMDTWFNRADFPRSFLRGSGEGSWWAFVSMTTVGYGDRTPRSLHARLFAVIWIVFGLVLSSILTASLSTALTTVAMSETSTMRGKEICIEYSESVELTFVLQNGGKPKVYNDINDMDIALQEGKCTGVAMESNSFLYYWHRLSVNNHLQVRSLTPSEERSIGMIFTDTIYTNDTNRWSTFFPNFYYYNRDHLEALLSEAVNRLPKKLDQSLLNVASTEVNIFDSNSSYFAPLLASLGCVLFVLLLTGVAVEITRYYKKRGKKSKTTNDDNRNELRNVAQTLRNNR